MQWWLTAEPKDQDLLTTCGLHFRVWFPNSTKFKSEHQGLADTGVWISKFGDSGWTQLYKFSQVVKIFQVFGGY